VLFPWSDWVVLIVAVLGLGGLVGLGEGLRRWGWSPTSTRRLVHAGVGLFVVGTPLVFTRPSPVALLAALFVVINAGAKSMHWWRGLHAARPESWGTVAMPLALLPALAATWMVDPDRIFILQSAFLVLALADPLAAWIGEKRGGAPLVGAATGAGSTVFAGVSALLAGGMLLGGAGWAVGPSAAGAILVAVVATAVEAISRRGWDNFAIVIGVILVLVPLHEAPGALSCIALALVGGTAFGGAAYAGRTLDAEGAVAGGLFAASLVGLGGWAWATPGIVFFVLASALSRIGEAVLAGDGAAEGERRTLRQVLANGGVAWGLLGLFVVAPPGASGLQTTCYAGFLGALAAAAADTWATEIGVRSVGRPWSLRTFSRVEAGESGAVSVVGTGGAALGAATVAGTAFLTGEAFGIVHWTTALKIVGAGMGGMAVDSVVGATLQARYRDPDAGKLVEEIPDSSATPALGWSVIDNEAVNLLGTAAGAGGAILLV